MAKRPFVPLRQGGLDGLCGVYAIVNAVRFLIPAVDQQLAEDLFHRLMRKLKRVGPNPLEVIRIGIVFKLLRKIARSAARFLHKRLGVRVKVRRFNKGWSATPALRILWSKLQARLGTNAVAIIGISGAIAHWTVATRASRQLIRLADSDGMAILTRSHCSVAPPRRKYWISPDEILILQLKGGARGKSEAEKLHA